MHLCLSSWRGFASPHGVALLHGLALLLFMAWLCFSRVILHVGSKNDKLKSMYVYACLFLHPLHQLAIGAPEICVQSCHLGPQGAVAEAAAQPAAPAEAAETAEAATETPGADSGAPEPSSDARGEDGDAGAEGKVGGTEGFWEHPGPAHQPLDTSHTSAAHQLGDKPCLPLLEHTCCSHNSMCAERLQHIAWNFPVQELSAAAKKKLKKKSKKAGTDADADADADVAPAPGKKAAGGKKPSAAVRKMQEALERQQRLQEEARLAAEEAARKVPTRSHAHCRVAACALWHAMLHLL